MKLGNVVLVALGLAGMGVLAMPAQAQSYTIPFYEFSSVAVDYPVDAVSNPARLYSLQGCAGQTFATVDPPTNAGQDVVMGGFFETAVKYVYKGTVTLGDFNNVAPVTIDTIPFTLQLRNTFDNALGEEIAGSVNADGTFTAYSWVNPAPIITVLDNGVPTAKTFVTDMSLKASHWLRQRVVLAQGDPVTGYPTGTFNLINGDANNDNGVNIFDLATLADAFNTNPGDAKWNPEADFNGDLGVNIFDLGILAQNFNQDGDE